MIKYISIAVIIWFVFWGLKSLYQNIQKVSRPEESDVCKLIGMYTKDDRYAIAKYYATIIGLIIGHVINLLIKIIVPIMVFFN